MKVKNKSKVKMHPIILIMGISATPSSYVIISKVLFLLCYFLSGLWLN